MELQHYTHLLAAIGCRRSDSAGRIGWEQEIQVEGQRIALWLIPGRDGVDARLMARTDVARLDAPASPALCRQLLRANAFWSGIHGGAIGLRGPDTVMLSVAQRLESLDACGLQALLERMAADARRWAAAVHGRTPAAPERAPAHGLRA